MCKKYEEFHYPITSLPIAKGIVFSKKQCPQSQAEMAEMEKIPYRNLIGCLAFLASRTRPDIAYATNIFSQYQQEPGMAHWQGLLKLLGYVKYTQSLKLNISNLKELKLIAYSDADYANNKNDRTSMGGQIIFLGKVPIEWRSFKQKAIALSTLEAEFVALTEAAKELVWISRILNVKNQSLSHRI
ncbi:Secreted RxLR effector protein 161 like protein [Argiope bruennichi]|uniref:Secreted RxLR effector protein 161 like protein n=1 Tax=Argiope bruennichi TaxID=94029 RepID=A0A8T0G474_ARGBR|nr:Secreted RxLR effector protein 161 like protein [Argiope bruennichi]